MAEQGWGKVPENLSVLSWAATGGGGPGEAFGFTLDAGCAPGTGRADPGPPPRARLRGYDQESRAALAAAWAAARLATRTAPGTAVAGLVWATGTAGASSYLQVLRDASRGEFGPGTVTAGPRSSYNAPLAAVSISLGLRGPQLSLAGGPGVRPELLQQASELLAEPDVDGPVLVGASIGCPCGREVGAVALTLAIRTGGPADAPTAAPAVLERWAAPPACSCRAPVPPQGADRVPQTEEE